MGNLCSSPHTPPQEKKRHPKRKTKKGSGRAPLAQTASNATPCRSPQSGGTPANEVPSSKATLNAPVSVPLGPTEDEASLCAQEGQRPAPFVTRVPGAEAGDLVVPLAAQNPLMPGHFTSAPQSTEGPLRESDDELNDESPSAAFSDGDWSRKVSHDNGDEDWQRKFSTLTDDDRRYSTSSATTQTSSEIGEGSQPGRVVASRRPVRSSAVGDSCASSVVDGTSSSRSLRPKAEEKLLRRKMRALVLWIATLQLPPYEEIVDVNGDQAQEEPWDDDAERRFSKVE